VDLHQQANLPVDLEKDIVLQKQLEDLAVQLGSATILLAYAESDKHWQFFFFLNFFFLPNGGFFVLYRET
jgi:hypothetical protein